MISRLSLLIRQQLPQMLLKLVNWRYADVRGGGEG
jgi:hypothetical protein